MKAYEPTYNGGGWWRDIPGYGGKYQASRIGGVRRVYGSTLVRDMTPYKKTGKMFRNRLFVKLTVDGKSAEVALLKIMADTWLGGCPNGLVAYHKNGIVTDNRVDNIGFATRQELGRMTGHMADKRRTVLKVDRSGQAVAAYRSAREAARNNHMSYQTVMDRCNGKIKNPFSLDGHTYVWEDAKAGRRKNGTVDA